MRYLFKTAGHLASHARWPIFPIPLINAIRFAFALILALPLYSCATTTSAHYELDANALYRVSYVYDGDTVLLTPLGSRVGVKFRMSDIDAPEHDQAFGAQATQALKGLCQNALVKVSSHGHDKYNRALGRLYCQQQDASLYLAQRGWAWLYPASTNMEIKVAVDRAKHLRLGLWSQSRPIPPWQWRKRKP